MGNDNSNEKEKEANNNNKIITDIIDNNNNTNNKNKKEEKVITFINTNNTCYANSIIQALLSLKNFKEKIISYFNANNVPKNSTLKSISELFYIIENKKKSEILNINDFINTIKSNNQEFNNEEHHDAHEFLTWLLDEIEQNINSIQKKNKKNNNKNNITNSTNTNNNNNDNFISDLFSGQQSSITKCLKCENTSEVFETFYNLSLDIETNSSLIYCLKNYFGKEILRSKDKFFCEKCNTLQEAEKKVNLIKLPKILIIQLKRFKMKNYSNLVKLLGYVSIPKKFNANFLLKTKEEKEYNYKLKNMVIHLGQRGEYGHYFTLVNQGNNKWINFNDERYSYLSDNDIFKFFGNVDEDNNNFYYTTYLLFYELI